MMFLPSMNSVVMPLGTFLASNFLCRIFSFDSRKLSTGQTVQAALANDKGTGGSKVGNASPAPITTPRGKTIVPNSTSLNKSLAKLQPSKTYTPTSSLNSPFLNPTTPTRHQFGTPASRSDPMSYPSPLLDDATDRVGAAGESDAGGSHQELNEDFYPAFDSFEHLRAVAEGHRVLGFTCSNCNQYQFVKAVKDA